MKTLLQTQATVVNLDDIIFAGRNHDYGAYELRKKYHKHLFFSFLITSSIFIFVVVTTYIYVNHIGSSLFPDHHVIINVDPHVVDIPIVPPPPPPPPTQIMINMVTWRPNVVDTTDQSNPIPIIDDLINLNVIKPYDTTGMFIDKGKPEPDPIEPAVITVTESALFEGEDINSFGKWVMNNLKYTDEIRDMHLEGRLTIRFVVNKIGLIEDVKVIRGIDPLLDNESVRVIKTSPKWIPGKLNGRIIRQQFVLPIVFKIQNQ